MASSSFLNRPVSVIKPKFGCSNCQDGGLIPIAGATQTEKYADLFATNMPCVCAAGDQWRPEFDLRAEPPKCACGRKAVYCVLSDRPVCKTCFGDVVAEYREAMAARVGGYSAPKVWKGWKKPTDETSRITEADFAKLAGSKG